MVVWKIKYKEAKLKNLLVCKKFNSLYLKLFFIYTKFSKIKSILKMLKNVYNWYNLGESGGHLDLQWN